MTGRLRVGAFAVSAALLILHISAANPPEAADWIVGFGGRAERATDGAIESVDLTRSWIGDIDLRGLAGLDKLERLVLAQTHVTDSALAELGSLTALRELDLFFCEHVTDAGASALRSATKLERLNVRGTKISDSGVKFLSELKHLRWLDIGITEISDASIELLSALPDLEFLAIGGNRIGEAGISSLRSLGRLKHLDLSGAQETDSGIWAVTITDLNLDEIGGLQGLESLNLAAPSPEYVDAVSSGVPRLRGAIRVTDFGASQIARLENLSRLNVSRSLVTVEGIRVLSALARLEDLDLSHARSVDDLAGEALAGFPKLRAVNVSYTQFGDRGLAALGSHSSLKRVIAAGTRISDEAVAKFVAARPGRDVVR